MTAAEKLADDDEREKLKNRTRLLAEWDMLCRYTDAENTIDRRELMKLLAEKHYKMSDHTLKDDIIAMNQMEGHEHDIEEGLDGHTRTLRVKNPRFATEDLRLIIDALRACSLSSDKKVQKLTEEIRRLGSLTQRDKLDNGFTVTASYKTHNEAALGNIMTLDEADYLKKRLEFQYFYVNEHHEPVLQKDGRIYTVEMKSVVYSDGKYYLLAWDCDAERLAFFRVDRMVNLHLTDITCSAGLTVSEAKVKHYLHETVGMFLAPEKETKLSLRLNDLKAVGVVFEQFGDDTKIIRKDDNDWSAEVTVQQSAMLWGWLCAEQDMITLEGPEEACRNYSAWLWQCLEKFEVPVQKTTE